MERAGAKRGRPVGQMTHRRRQILERYGETIRAGGTVSLARMARECGLYDFRVARRVMRDLGRMGALA